MLNTFINILPIMIGNNYLYISKLKIRVPKKSGDTEIITLRIFILLLTRTRPKNPIKRNYRKNKQFQTKTRFKNRYILLEYKIQR